MNTYRGNNNARHIRRAILWFRDTAVVLLFSIYVVTGACVPRLNIGYSGGYSGTGVPNIAVPGFVIAAFNSRIFNPAEYYKMLFVSEQEVVSFIVVDVL